MPTEPPVACSLDTTELPARLREISALGRDALLQADVDGRRAQLRFAAHARERVDAVAAAEARCCLFLAFSVDAQAQAVVLTVEAPAGAEPALAELVEAFRS